MSSAYEYQTFLKEMDGFTPCEVLKELFRVRENSSATCISFHKKEKENLELKKKIKELEKVNQALVLEKPNAKSTIQNVWYRDALKTCFVEAKKRAAKNKVEFSIEFEELYSRHEEPKCTLSDIPYFQCKKFFRNPFNPSIDRIDSNKGYTKDNTRVVAACINNAMNEWGEDILKFMSIRYITKIMANTPIKLIHDILEE